jgi:hypothetical protein
MLDTQLRVVKLHALGVMRRYDLKAGVL